ncbi:unnamed protein product [Blepharisma stoltei]|uniref:Uncharacterized protein n=1 Tax=Blepharisma stoltei TaxID=1481888 RepID=A0AAU9JG25_9CILI|nr:unnamed protein product [Blepharisma stoltei]
MIKEVPRYRSGIFCRENAELRIMSGTSLSVFCSGNFALMTALISELTYAETAFYVGKYSFGALAISPIYFFTNEIITTQLKNIGINNFYISHTISAGLCMPLFGAFQYYIRKLNFAESKSLSYRYIGTLCCGALIFDAILSTTKHLALGNISFDKISSFFSRAKTN